MSMLRILPCSLGLSVCVLFPALAQSPAINVKTGLWEVSSTRSSSGMPKMSAMPQIPPGALAAMPPSQRARIENAMKAARGQAGGTRVKKSCVTRESLERGLAFGAESRPNCKRTVSNRSATEWELRESCADPRGRQIIVVRYEAPTPETINGTVNITMNDGGRSMSMKQVMRGRWVGPDCGDVKPE